MFKYYGGNGLGIDKGRTMDFDFNKHLEKLAKLLEQKKAGEDVDKEILEEFRSHAEAFRRSFYLNAQIKDALSTYEEGLKHAGILFGKKTPEDLDNCKAFVEKNLTANAKRIVGLSELSEAEAEKLR